MKKTITTLALTVPLTLGLAACGTDTTEDTAGDFQPAPETSATETTAQQQSGPVELELGETAHLTQGANGPRDITVTVDDITVSDQCHQGLNSYSDGYSNDNGYFIQLTGEFEVTEHQTNYSVGVHSWNGTTEDGYAVNFQPASECNDPQYDMSGYQSFSDPIDVGQKARAIEEYWVEELPTSMILTGPYEPVDYSWPVPNELTTGGAATQAQETAPVTTSSTQTPATQVETQQPAPQPPTRPTGAMGGEPVVGMTGAPGADTPAPMDKQIQECLSDPTMYQPGTTVFTDGTTGWTEHCAAQ